MPYDDGSFDLVVAKYVLHHAHNRKLLLEEIVRVSKTHVIIIEEKCSKNRQKILLYIYDIYYNLI